MCKRVLFLLFNIKLTFEDEDCVRFFILGINLPLSKPIKFKLMKRVLLVIIMMISTLGIYSFTNTTNDAKTSFASYYHDKFNGRRTASGEIFNNKNLTAANKTLPFGTKVKVTNLRTKKSVVVRINDRGPFTKGRSLDLSKAAFNSIANHRSGTIPVEYEIID